MHSIRLRGPWQLEPIERFSLDDGTYVRFPHGLPPRARETMPTNWSASLGSDFLGLVRYHRIFQKPTGLDSGERIFLVVEPPRSCGVVSLNERELGIVNDGGAAGRFEITEQLEDQNRLQILVYHPALDETGRAYDDSKVQFPGGLVGQVRLEIEESGASR